LGSRKDIRTVKSPFPLIYGSSFLEQVEEDSRENRLTQVYLDKQPLNGNISSSDVVPVINMVRFEVFHCFMMHTFD